MKLRFYQLIYNILLSLIFKSMKFLIFFLSYVSLIYPARNSDSKCGQGKVANQKNFCIEPMYIQGCLKYQNQTKCFECEKGYKIGNRGCDALQFDKREEKLIGCLEKSENRQKCQNCAKQFIRTKDKCTLGIENCMVYDQNYECIQCKLGYTLVLNKCMYNNQVGCKKASSNHTCSQCEQPFQLKDLKCHIKNCKIINDYGCVTCLCGYYLTTGRSCQKMQYGCLRYERGRCIDCMRHYRLKGGHCQIQGCISYIGDSCIKCQQKYLNQNGGCIFRNCVDWLNNQCFSCQSGFRLQSGICSIEDELICKS